MRLVRKHIVRERIAETGCDRKKRIKPAARLVDSLCDEIRRIIALEGLPILEWKVPLGKGHRSGIEPCVDNLRSARLGSATLTLPGVSVDERFVRIELFAEDNTGSLGELLVAADCLGVRRVLIADPNRERRSPIAVARHGPIDVVRQPFTKSSGSSLGRMPVDARISRE